MLRALSARHSSAAFDAVIMCKLALNTLVAMECYLAYPGRPTMHVATERTLTAMYDMSIEDKKVWYDHGIAFFFDKYYHQLCVTEKIMNGDLAKLWTTSSYNVILSVYPYADIFIAKELSSSDGSESNSMVKDH